MTDVTHEQIALAAAAAERKLIVANLRARANDLRRKADANEKRRFHTTAQMQRDNADLMTVLARQYEALSHHDDKRSFEVDS